MRAAGLRRILALAALLPLALLSVSGGGASLFRCQLTGMIAPDPCCPDEASPVDGDAAARMATVAGTDCCLRETIAFAHPPAEAPVAPGHDGIGAIAVGDVVAPPATPSPVSFVRVAPPDVIPRPPLRLMKRSLLI